MITANNARSNKPTVRLGVRKIIKEINNSIIERSKDGLGYNIIDTEYMGMNTTNNYLKNLDLIKCSFIKRGFKIINLKRYDGIEIMWRKNYTANSITNLRFVVYLKYKKIKRFISNIFKAKTSNPIIIG